MRDCGLESKLRRCRITLRIRKQGCMGLCWKDANDHWRLLTRRFSEEWEVEMHRTTQFRSQPNGKWVGNGHVGSRYVVRGIASYY